MNGTAVITGASSGLGKAIYDLWEGPKLDWSFSTGVDVRDKNNVLGHAIALAKLTPQIDVLINCAGVNHIAFLPDLQEADWDSVMDTNAKGIFLVTQALLPMLKGGTVVNIVSNASHMPMTSSAAYCSSKGAAAILTKQLSRELIKTHGITVFGISPNKMRGTAMTEYIDQKVCELRGWTEQQARDYQLASLPAGEETDPAVLAEFICFLLSSKKRHKYLAGCILDYGL